MSDPELEPGTQAHFVEVRRPHPLQAIFGLRKLLVFAVAASLILTMAFVADNPNVYMKAMDAIAWCAATAVSANALGKATTLIGAAVGRGK